VLLRHDERHDLDERRYCELDAVAGMDPADQLNVGRPDDQDEAVVVGEERP
jgi:hypothetical protein